jgi:hypothetical protein
VRAAARAAAERFLAPAVVAAKVEEIVRCAVLQKRGRSRA